MKDNQMCCHCEPVRVWQSMENKKRQQRKRQTAKTNGNDNGEKFKNWKTKKNKGCFPFCR